MQIRSVGIDLGKTTFHLVALGVAGKVLARKKFTQKQLLTFTANMQTSLIGEVCTGTVRTKEQSKRWVCNLIPIMVFNDRPTCKDRHAAKLILARSTRLHQRPNTLPKTCLSPKLILAVTRRTIHCRYLCENLRVISVFRRRAAASLQKTVVDVSGHISHPTRRFAGLGSVVPRSATRKWNPRSSKRSWLALLLPPIGVPDAHSRLR